MLIIVLLKGVPARTTRVAQVGGVLNREAMDLVLNPHDQKAVEAADFVKRRVGGKTIALTMGPDMKLIPLMKPLYNSEVYGIDEEYVLSDRKMAGSDTLATSYAVSLGVKKLVETHVMPVQELSEAVKKDGYSEAVNSKARELYQRNLLPNKVYSELPSVKETIISRFLNGAATSAETVSALEAVKEELTRFMIVSGVKTTDGETGSVGPQVAEGVSELLGKVVPHATYVEDFDIDADGMAVISERKIGYLSQKLQMQLPCLLTVSAEYRPREPVASGQGSVRENNYRGKSLNASKWTADDLGADPKRLGLAGSPTIVGSGIDVGKPPVQKVVGRTEVFTQDVEKFASDDKSYGPFAKGDLVPELPESVLTTLQAKGAVGVFGYDQLAGELFS